MSKRKTRSTEEEAPSYEAVVERLEALVTKLEEGDLPLEAQIAAFEEGMKLVRRGQALLDAAERKVEVLLDESGETAPFEAGAASEPPEAVAGEDAF